jgi:hypothetical protein
MSSPSLPRVLDLVPKPRNHWRERGAGPAAVEHLLATGPMTETDATGGERLAR